MSMPPEGSEAIEMSAQPVSEPQLERTQHDSFRIETPANARIQRRKRTSPRDHARLESAYQRNSKPDKEERAALVQHTELTEKEVQIWFQNRRQNDRRKAKPLQPHELIPHFRSGVPVEAVKQLPSPQTSQEVPDSNDDATSAQLHEANNASPYTASARNSNVGVSSSPAVALQQTPGMSAALSTPPSTLERSIEVPHTRSGELALDLQAQVVKKRSHEQMTGHFGQFLAQGEASKQPKPLRRSSSFVRLAVSADGSVKVRVNDETTPSPPKERPAPPADLANRRSSGLSRAQSDVTSTFNFQDASASARGAVGRSRDARTWEFYCDRSARSSLAARAEEEASGSAVSAIGLLRSASQKRSQVLTPNTTKQNALRRSQSAVKSKPALARTQSSMARLQSSDGVYEDVDFKRPKLADHHRRSSGVDSDKENWAPGREAPVHEPGLKSSDRSEYNLPKQVGNNGHVHPTSTHPKKATAGAGKAKGDDLDCIQGLLSLSQGAWR